MGDVIAWSKLNKITKMVKNLPTSLATNFGEVKDSISGLVSNFNAWKSDWTSGRAAKLDGKLVDFIVPVNIFVTESRGKDIKAYGYYEHTVSLEGGYNIDREKSIFIGKAMVCNQNKSGLFENEVAIKDWNSSEMTLVTNYLTLDIAVMGTIIQFN